MKKNSINRLTVIIVAVLLMVTTTNTFATTIKEPLKRMEQAAHPDTPYLAMVQINFSSNADTPYFRFSIAPSLVYTQVASLLNRQSGLFHVLISFINKEGLLVGEDDYYIDHSH